MTQFEKESTKNRGHGDGAGLWDFFFLNFLFDFSDKKDSIRTISFDLLARSSTLGLSPGPKNQIWVKQKLPLEDNLKTKK